MVCPDRRRDIRSHFADKMTTGPGRAEIPQRGDMRSISGVEQ